jgi:hypothetical protein
MPRRPTSWPPRLPTSRCWTPPLWGRRRRSNTMRLLSTLVAWADELGRDDIVRLLTTDLNEEKAARTLAAL